jgi:hypothetical protein
MLYRGGTDGEAEFDEVPARTDEAPQAAACTCRIDFGPRGGQKVLTVQRGMLRDADFNRHLRADIDGFSLHAAVRCGADGRMARDERNAHPTLEAPPLAETAAAA